MSDENVERATRWLSQALGLKADETPFPWQSTLLDDFLNGKLPPAVDIPTGLGKTSVVAIWLIARALGATLPRRIVYVVDRRAVVDQATEEAIRIRNFAEQTPEVKNRLGIGQRSLPVSTLRGQYADNREWLDDPVTPAIIVGTVDMIGSRLLFQGYGVSRKMRPYHAGLLGSDALVVLDEAHLVPAFEDLLSDIVNGIERFGPRDHVLRQLVPGFRLMSLSATGRAATEKMAFRLTKKDLEHPIINRRLKGTKRVRIYHLNSGEELTEVIAEKAWQLSDKGKCLIRCIVFCDKREDAVKAKEAIENLARGDKKKGVEAVDVDTELFVGGRRVFERQEAAERLERLGFIAGKAIQQNRPAFLFATSAAEVGVDLDGDCMVCDLLPWERMVQRLGRVNRRGDVPGGADVMVILEQELQPDKRTQEALSKNPEERDEREKKTVEKYETGVATQRSLRKALDLLSWNNGAADASSGALRDLNERAERVPEIQQILKSATTAAPLRPELTRAVVDAWSMTSLELHTGRPEIDPWLRGWVEDDPPQTEIVWRTHLPVRTSGGRKIAPPKRESEAFFEAAPPHTSEVLETETFRVVRWLAARTKALLSGSNGTETANGTVRGHDIAAFVVSKSGKFRRALRVDEFQADKGEREQLHRLLANATLVIDARVGGLKHGLLDNTEAIVPRTADDGQPWIPALGFRVRSMDTGQSVPQDPNWRERFRFAGEVSEEGEPLRLLVVEKWRGDSTNEEDRSAGNPQLLEEHRTWVEDRVQALAKTLGLPDDYKEMFTTAAFLHDEGKRSHRWQRAFNAPDGKDAYAKTSGPINYDLLDGYRHEFGSIVAVEAHDRLRHLPASLRDFALHLIAAHHGFGRPFIEIRACDMAPPSALEAHARGIALRFAKLQQDWGPWGLAWWESVMRAADQQSSRDNDARNTQAASAIDSGRR